MTTGYAILGRLLMPVLHRLLGFRSVATMIDVVQAIIGFLFIAVIAVCCVLLLLHIVRCVARRDKEAIETIGQCILLAATIAVFWGALNVLSDYEDVLTRHMHSPFLHGLLNLAVLGGAILAAVAFIWAGGWLREKLVWHWRVYRWALKQVKR
jgi:hypothetical protein